ncbi:MULTISPECIES: UDP-glucose 4-epimerase GalE [Aphanothece]|uniref:UDP-glucose 4-epimerase GalE n=1 Tax=Aphanothece TaxID=1121 RepID=UPI00398539D6
MGRRETILACGGAGFIGSHACVVLLLKGYDVIVLDNFANARRDVLKHISKICGRKPHLIQGDIRNRACMHDVFANYRIDAVMHFAGLKSVSESVSLPWLYYDINVHGTLNLLTAMREAEVFRLIYSSSCTVYGNAEHMPLTEDCARGFTSPYGHTKLVVEDILHEFAKADTRWAISCLRYFNPLGAHKSGTIGERQLGTPSNLMPLIVQVAAGERDFLRVYGNDYPTADGTAVRDYIHVMDLVEGHLAALVYIQENEGWHAVNLGRGKGTSVLQLIGTFETAVNRSVPWEFAPRRFGDIPVCWADPTLASRLYGWAAHRSLEQMCLDAWHWQCSYLP